MIAGNPHYCVGMRDKDAEIERLSRENEALCAFIDEYVNQAEASGGWKGDESLFAKAIAIVRAKQDAAARGGLGGDGKEEKE